MLPSTKRLRLTPSQGVDVGFNSHWEYQDTITSFGNQARKPQFVCELVIAEKWPITYDKDACGGWSYRAV